jgi:hypothetical protein
VSAVTKQDIVADGELPVMEHSRAFATASLQVQSAAHASIADEQTASSQDQTGNDQEPAMLGCVQRDPGLPLPEPPLLELLDEERGGVPTSSSGPPGAGVPGVPPPSSGGAPEASGVVPGAIAPPHAKASHAVTAQSAPPDFTPPS